MRIPAVLLTVLTLIAAQAATSALRPSAQQADDMCGQAGVAHSRTTLYFGLNRPTGAVSEDDWQAFLRNEVTPRFPDGLTVWEAAGQWRRPDGTIGRERAKVLLLVHGDTPASRAALGAVVARYKAAFEQESVLWESARVCATF